MGRPSPTRHTHTDTTEKVPDVLFFCPLTELFVGTKIEKKSAATLFVVVELRFLSAL